VPEGDSLYRFARTVGAALEGKQILVARSHAPGPAPQVHRIVGTTCTGVRSTGKNLLISFDNGLVLRGHLRMYGTWHVYAPGEEWRKPEREARLVLEVDDAVVVNFSAPVIELLEERALGTRPHLGTRPGLLAMISMSTMRIALRDLRGQSRPSRRDHGQEVAARVATSGSTSRSSTSE